MRSTAFATTSGSRHRRTLAAAGFSVAIALAAGPAARAQTIGCGSVVGPDETVVLDADLGCTSLSGGITVIGPATLDLGGHSIRCAQATDLPIGVTLIGKRAQLKNGSIAGCRIGVEMAGDGRHRVEQIVATANFEAAFRLDSSGSTLRGSTGAGTTNGIDFVVRGDHNVLDGNTTSAPDLAPAPIGFRIDGDANRLRGNSSADHRQWGFLIDFPHERNVLRANVATGNGAAGIQVDGPQSSITGNTVLANGHEGIFVTAAASRLTRNDVRGNGSSGIRLFADVGDASISRNTALGNDRRGLGAWDLEDGSPQCATNRWHANVFATANDPCIE